MSIICTGTAMKLHSKFIYNILIWQRSTCEESLEICPSTKLSTFNNPVKILWNTSAEGLVFSPVTFQLFKGASFPTSPI